MRYIIPALLLSVASVAHADELVFHTFSIHSKSEHEHRTRTLYVYDDPSLNYTKVDVTMQSYNNNNFGLGYKFNNGWEVGGYHNSYNRPTFYLAKEWMITDSFGVVAGAGTGYSMIHDGRKISFIGALEYKYKLDDKWTAVAQFVPPVKSMDMVGVAHLAFTRSFKGLGNE